MSLAPEIPVTKKRPALELLLGRIQANARAVVRSVRPAPVAAPVKPAAAAPEKIDAFDDRWSTPQKPPLAAAPPVAAAPEKIDAFDDRWSTPQKPPLAVAPPVAAAPVAAAPEKIDAFDDRWSSPPRPPLATAAPKAASAPVAAPSGDRVSRLNSLLSRIKSNRR